MMKVTKILVKAFNCDLDLTLKRKEFLNIKQAEKYVHENLTPTAFIKSIIHYDNENEIITNNNNYNL